MPLAIRNRLEAFCYLLLQLLHELKILMLGFVAAATTRYGCIVVSRPRPYRHRNSAIKIVRVVMIGRVVGRISILTGTRWQRDFDHVLDTDAQALFLVFSFHDIE